MNNPLNTFPLIIIKDLEYTYPNGTKALDKININIRKGELIGIMGQNGAGKTTLIRTLNGLIRPTKGEIILEGENIADKSIGLLSKSVGIMFQNPEHQLFSNTVEEEITFSLKSLNINKENLQNETLKVLKLFGIEKYREKSPLNLSGGEKKKLALASVICRDPRLLVFDEPTLGQDSKEINFFIDLMSEERKKGKTIIIVTHNVEFAMEHIPRIVLMSNGNIIADGPTHQVLTNEFLIERSSLVLPKIQEFFLELIKANIKPSYPIFLKSEMINFLKHFLKQINSEN